MSDINDLNATGVITNIGTLATGTRRNETTQINTVAGAVGNVILLQQTERNDFADKYRISSSDHIKQ